MSQNHQPGKFEDGSVLPEEEFQEPLTRRFARSGCRLWRMLLFDSVLRMWGGTVTPLGGECYDGSMICAPSCAKGLKGAEMYRRTTSRALLPFGKGWHSIFGRFASTATVARASTQPFIRIFLLIPRLRLVQCSMINRMIFALGRDDAFVLLLRELILLLHAPLP